MHILGLWGMPRRVYTYPAELGWGPLNLVSTIGALVFALSFALLLWNVFRSLRRGEHRWGQSVGRWHAGMGDILARRRPIISPCSLTSPIANRVWAERDTMPVVTGLARRPARASRHKRNLRRT